MNTMRHDNTVQDTLFALDKAITKYERGMALVKQCREILSKAENKIQQLQERADGSLETTPFPGADRKGK